MSWGTFWIICSRPSLAAVLIGGYLLGSIPFGLIAARLGGAGDIRNVGSGNIGATNVFAHRAQGFGADHPDLRWRQGRCGGVVGPWLVGQSAGAEAGRLAQALAGAAAFLGHLFPVWLRFKGGKGVATFFGTLLAVAWPVGVIGGAIWLIVAWRAKLSSLAA